MPAERRDILFRPLEYVEAIRFHRRRCGLPAITGRFLRSALSSEEPLSVEIVMESAGGEASITVRQDELLSALIFACLQSRIPMPARIPKALRREAECLAITMRAEFPMGMSRGGATPGRPAG